MGHMIGMEDDRNPKAILRESIDGQRRKGSPRRRWLQDVEDDLRRTDIGDWRRSLEATSRGDQASSWAVPPEELTN